MSRKNKTYPTSDNSLSSFVAGVATGAIIALLLGTEKGRQLAREFFKEAQDLTRYFKPDSSEPSSQRRQPHSPPPQRQVLNRLKRNTSSTKPSSFTKDGQPLKS